MTCDEAQKLLDAYVDGELDWSSKLAIESHLQGCRTCSSVLASLKLLVSALQRGALRFKAPQHLRSVVLSGIERANPAILHSFAGWRWAGIPARSPEPRRRPRNRGRRGGRRRSGCGESRSSRARR